VSAQLTYLKRFYKKIYSKEYCFVKQSLCELKIKETMAAKTGFNLTVMETINILKVESPVFKACWLPSANLFAFNLSFF